MAKLYELTPDGIVPRRAQDPISGEDVPGASKQGALRYMAACLAAGAIATGGILIAFQVFIDTPMVSAAVARIVAAEHARPVVVTLVPESELEHMLAQQKPRETKR